MRIEPSNADKQFPSPIAGHPPNAGLFVIRVKRVFGVKEDVGVDKYQRESSPSICANNS
jgi:hypothetical protein